MLEKSAYEMGGILHVPPHGSCGAFGAGQPCHSARVHEIRWINEVWLVVFLGKYGFGVLCILRRCVAFLGYLCGICVALALWVGALYSDDRLNTKTV